MHRAPLGRRYGPLLQTFEGHNETIRTVAFRRDGKRVLSTGHDKTVRVWDIETAKCFEVLKGSTLFVSASFLPESKGIVACEGLDSTAPAIRSMIS